MSEYNDERNDRKYAVVDMMVCDKPQVVTLKIPMHDYNDMAEGDLVNYISDYKVGWSLQEDTHTNVLGVTYTDAD